MGAGIVVANPDDIVVVANPEPSGVLCVMDGSGDSRIQWDKNNSDQVAAAEARFNELRKRGYLAYTVDAKGRQGTVIDKFDPDAERIIMNPRMVGG